MENVGKFFVGVLLYAVGILARGFVLVALWSWFIASTFGVRELTIPIALGLQTLLSFLTVKPKDIKTPEDTDNKFNKLLKDFATSLLLSGVALFMGWLITLFM